MHTGQRTLKQRPVVAFHGLLMSCDIVMTQGFEKLNYRCIETGKNIQSLKPIAKQGKYACKVIKKMIETDPDAFSNGFYILGFSLGGLIARHLLHFCRSLKSPIKRLITSSSPNLGVRGLPNFNKAHMKSLIGDAKLAIGDALFSGGAISYQGILDNKASWSEKTSMFELYNVFSKKASIITRFEGDSRATDKYASLELFMALGSRDEVLVRPFSTATFGADYNKETDSLEPFTKSQMYSQNYFGLKDMYDKGKFVICLNRNTHNDFTPKAVDEINAFIADDCIFDDETFNGMSTDELYELCLYKKITSRNGSSELHCQPDSKVILDKPGVVQRLYKISRKKRRRRLTTIKRIRRKYYI